MSRAELLSLPASVDIVTAGRAFGLGRTTAYQLARTGSFPCKVLRTGKAYRAITADLLRVLLISPDNENAAAGATAAASDETPSSTSADQ
jgi:hypothetical protein